jgi:hypothetical protein
MCFFKYENEYTTDPGVLSIEFSLNGVQKPIGGFLVFILKPISGIFNSKQRIRNNF